MRHIVNPRGSVDLDIFHPRLTGILNSKTECRVYITTGPEVKDIHVTSHQNVSLNFAMFLAC